MSDRLFPALLKYWRGRNGLSQLDLALAADISSRHLSYLETGRAKPSDSMVLRLFSTMGVPLRHQNEALVAAGFERRFDEPALTELPAPVQDAIARMLQQQEPFPMTVLAADYRIIDRNAAADAVFSRVVADPARLASGPLDMVALIFDPALARDAFPDWPATARRVLGRLQRELLRTGDERLGMLLERALQYPGVDPAWRHSDDTDRADATLEVRLHRGDLELGFLTTLTAFTSPGTVSLEEIRLESYFPLDDATRVFCMSQSRGHTVR
ncbi:helix-turn-helix transcriptional regulator [soil metagenome]